MFILQEKSRRKCHQKCVKFTPQNLNEKKRVQISLKILLILQENGVKFTEKSLQNKKRGKIYVALIPSRKKYPIPSTQNSSEISPRGLSKTLMPHVQKEGGKPKKTNATWKL